MTKAKHHVPEGSPALVPYLIVEDAARAIEFYEDALGATELFRMPTGEKIGHAELQIGSARFMLADEFPDMDALGPIRIGGSPVTLLIYVPSSDEVVSRAVSLGAKLIRPVADQFYGDRSGGIEDPFGHKWWISTHVEDLTPDELAERAAKAHR